MQNKLLAFIRQQNMLSPGEQVVCAVSGGADSVALLFAMYLLKEKLKIQLSAAHFNHHLRGAESDRDEQFVRALCDRYEIPLYVGAANVTAGKKGLEAAARDARYAFLGTLPGKIATAHTADDNAETVLLHLIRGTGLKGLGGITPAGEKLIRPMLCITRQEVEDFLKEWGLNWVEDSSNGEDAFLRNRLRHRIMPLLKEENPKIAENVSAMALRLRQDEAFLASSVVPTRDVETLKAMHPAQRGRALEAFLKEIGLREPEAVHISQVEALLDSPKPSARVHLPEGVTVARNYGVLERWEEQEAFEEVILHCPGTVALPGLRIICRVAREIRNTEDTFTVIPQGTMVLRPREPGDTIRRSGGSKSLKKLFIDRKIPAALRPGIPVLADDAGVLGAYRIGVNLDRAAQELPAVQIRFAVTEK